MKDSPREYGDGSSVWFELRPYRTDDEKAGEDNMYKILEHLPKFLFIIYREQSTTRIYVRVGKHHRATLTDLVGIEVLAADPPPLYELPRYRKYRAKRHCAMPISPKRMDITSPYRTMGDQVGGPAFIAMYLKRIHSSPAINSYISNLSRGEEAEGIMRYTKWLSLSPPQPKKPSPLKLDKVRQAREKIASRSLFHAKITVGAQSKDDIQTISGLFPSGAFVSDILSPTKVQGRLCGDVKPGLLGGNRFITLNPEEIIGFLTLPTNDDITTVEFELGILPAKSSGAQDYIPEDQPEDESPTVKYSEDRQDADIDEMD